LIYNKIFDPKFKSSPEKGIFLSKNPDKSLTDHCFQFKISEDQKQNSESCQADKFSFLLQNFNPFFLYGFPNETRR